MDAEPIQPFVFVVGCPRSGTTLVQRLLDNHPDLAVANDTHFVPRCLEKLVPERIEDAVRGVDIPLTPELVAGVRDYHRFGRLGLTDADVDAAARSSDTYASFVAALYGRFAAAHGKRLGGEKTPDYVRRLPLLHGLFPRTRSVHIIRDGRDVTLSLLEWANEKKGPGRLALWNAEPVATSALWWSWQVQSGRRAGRQLGPRHYHEVRYEALVADPEASVQRVADFLGLARADEMLAFHEGRTRSDPKLSAKSAWLPPTQGLRDWRSQLPDRDVALFEALAGDLLDELGLERASGAPIPAVVRTADACRAWWDDERARREERLRARIRRRG